MASQRSRSEHRPLSPVLGVVVRVQPWYTPQYIIPIAGLMLGNAMTSAALDGDRLQSDLLTIKYQVMIVFTLAATTALASLLFVWLAARRYLTAAHPLRRYRL